MRGRLISVEGLDGTGKSTVCDSLRARLAAAGIDVVLHREPGGTPLGERIRGLLKDPEAHFGARAELLLFAAARAELVDSVIEPALRAGRWVLLDRFTDSTLAYQGAGRGLGEELTAGANQLATGGLTPDRTLLLQLPPELRAERLGGRGEVADRLELAGAAMFERAGAHYDELARRDPHRIRAIDASGTPDQVVAHAWDAIADLTAAGATR